MQGIYRRGQVPGRTLQELEGRTRVKCPKCELQLDFEGRYIVREDFEAGAPAQIRDMEVWKCDNCGSYYEASRSGQPVPIRFMQSLFKRLE